MRISSKGRYALRVMLYMAMNDSKSHISVRDIANNLNISNKYLEQILSILSKSGLVSYANDNLVQEKDTIWIYIKMNDAINSVVDNITLADMVEKKVENLEALYI